MTGPRVSALCCVCGQLREVSDAYRCYDGNEAREGDRHLQGFRMTGTLKCEHCEEKTCHALLRHRDDIFRDMAEGHMEHRRGTPHA